MKESGGGAIINVASVSAVRPALFQGVYSIPKAGVVAMTKSFAKELAPFGIRVNALLPGLTDTRFSSAIIQNSDIMKAMRLMITRGRVAVPQEMARGLVSCFRGIVLYNGRMPSRRRGNAFLRGTATAGRKPLIMQKDRSSRISGHRLPGPRAFAVQSSGAILQTPVH